MLVSAPTMSSGDAGSTGVITSGGTKEGVLGERTGDLGVRGRLGRLGKSGLAAPLAGPPPNPPRSRSGRVGRGDGVFGRFFGGPLAPIGAGDGAWFPICDGSRDVMRLPICAGDA